MSDRMDWFPFYATDFLTSRKILRMSDTNVGRYVKLLAESWLHGPLPKDMGEMGLIVRLAPAEMAKAWRQIGVAFVETEQGFVNTRLENIRAEQAAKMEKRANAGRRGAEARWADSNRNADALPPQSDTNGNRDKKEKESREEERTTNSMGRKKKRPLPDEWKPNDQHRALATELGVTLKREAEAFRDHATANRRLLADWDAGFRSWLRKARDYQHPSPGSQAARIAGEKPRDSEPRGEGPARLTVQAGGASEDPVERDMRQVAEWERSAPKAERDRLRKQAADEVQAMPDTAALVASLGQNAADGRVLARYRKLVLEQIGRAA